MFGGACVVGRGVFGGVCGWWEACVVGGGHVWLVGGMHGCQGVCMVAGGCVVGRGHAWFAGGVHGWLRGMHGCWGACVVAGRGHAWLRGGGVHRIRRDTVNERAVRILLECILV